MKDPHRLEDPRHAEDPHQIEAPGQVEAPGEGGEAEVTVLQPNPFLAQSLEPPEVEQTAPITAESLVMAERYELRQLVGEGAAGSVYRAFDRVLEEEIAIKVLRESSLEQPEKLARFKREVRLARRIPHINVARMFDFGQDEGTYFLTMELVEGRSLGSILREERLSVERALCLLKQICAGLDAAHQSDVVHLDLKPENILVTDGGRVAITDFGIARHISRDDIYQTVATQMLGTPAYMAPEQFQGRQGLGPTADIYAFGVLSFELLTGQPAWKGDNFFAVAMGRFFQSTPDPREIDPGLPDGLAEIAMRCMAVIPKERYPSARALSEALDRVALEEPQTTQRFDSPFLDSFESAQTTQLTTGALEEGLQTPAEGVASHSSTSPQDAFDLQRPPTQPFLASFKAQDTDAGLTSLAILPFQNRGQEDDRFLMEAVMEELHNALSISLELSVCPPGLAQPFAGPDIDPQEVGRILGVAHFLKGQLQRTGKLLNIQVSLFCTGDGAQRWSAAFPTDFSSFLETCKQIAEAVEGALLTGSIPSSPGLSTIRSPMDRESQEIAQLYLRARHLMRTPGRQGKDEALRLFREALARAPHDHLLLAGASVARARQVFEYEAPGAPQVESAFHLARRALQAAPKRNEPLIAMALLQLLQSQWSEALATLEQVLARTPSHADAHELCGRVCLEVGSLDQALQHLHRAISVDPDLSETRWDLARAYALLQRWEKVDEIFLWPLVGQKEHLWLAIQMTRFNLWRPQPEPVDIAFTLRETDSDELGLILLRKTFETGIFDERDQQRFQKRLAINRSHRQQLHMLQELAELFAYTGQWEQVLDTLERALQLQLFDRNWMLYCPLFSPIRSAPMFKEMLRYLDRQLRQMGLLS